MAENALFFAVVTCAFNFSAVSWLMGSVLGWFGVGVRVQQKRRGFLECRALGHYSRNRTSGKHALVACLSRGNSVPSSKNVVKSGSTSLAKAKFRLEKRQKGVWQGLRRAEGRSSGPCPSNMARRWPSFQAKSGVAGWKTEKTERRDSRDAETPSSVNPFPPARI